MNMYNLKLARGFGCKFPFDCLVIFENLLSNKVIIIDVFLIAFQKGVIHLCFYGLSFCNKGNIHQHVKENVNAPVLAFSTIELVGCIEYIIVASLISGDHDRSNFFAQSSLSDAYVCI